MFYNFGCGYYIIKENLQLWNNYTSLLLMVIMETMHDAHLSNPHW